jgi:hypothetical protein
VQKLVHSKAMMVYHQVLPASYTIKNKKVGTNMLNSIIQKSIENNYRDILKVLKSSDVVRTTRKKSIVVIEKDYSAYRGSFGRKKYVTIDEDRYILKVD